MVGVGGCGCEVGSWWEWEAVGVRMGDGGKWCYQRCACVPVSALCPTLLLMIHLIFSLLHLPDRDVHTGVSKWRAVLNWK